MALELARPDIQHTHTKSHSAGVAGSTSPCAPGRPGPLPSGPTPASAAPPLHLRSGRGLSFWGVFSPRWPGRCDTAAAACFPALARRRPKADREVVAGRARWRAPAPAGLHRSKAGGAEALTPGIGRPAARVTPPQRGIRRRWPRNPLVLHRRAVGAARVVCSRSLSLTSRASRNRGNARAAGGSCPAPPSPSPPASPMQLLAASIAHDRRA